MTQPTTVLITGCSSGIGHATAERLVAAGWTVYATARKPETLVELEARGCRTLALVAEEKHLRTVRVMDAFSRLSVEREAVVVTPEGCGRRMLARRP